MKKSRLLKIIGILAFLIPIHAFTQIFSFYDITLSLLRGTWKYDAYEETFTIEFLSYDIQFPDFIDPLPPPIPGPDYPSPPRPPPPGPDPPPAPPHPDPTPPAEKITNPQPVKPAEQKKREDGSVRPKSGQDRPGKKRP